MGCFETAEPSMRTISVRLDDSSEAKLDNLCQALGLSQSDVVKAGLAERLRDKLRRQRGDQRQSEIPA